MARKRMIDPAFFLDDEVASLSAHARLLYIGSWTLADDTHFTLPYNPDWIRAQIFPYESAIDVEKLIDEIVGIGKYFPFTNGGDREYLFIPTMSKHQTINRPSAPKYPAHPDMDKIIKEVQVFIEGSRSTHSQYNIREDKLSKDSPLFSLFEELWMRYPSKVGKQKAMEAFMRTVKTDKDQLDIRKALDNYLLSDRVKNNFIQNGKTWFNDWSGWVHMAPKPVSMLDKYEVKKR